MSSNLLRYQSETGCAVGNRSTRCCDKCVNTVLLQTEGPCGSVRKCSAGTVTDDTSAQEDIKKNLKNDYNQNSKNMSSSEGTQNVWRVRAPEASINRQISRFGVLSSFTPNQTLLTIRDLSSMSGTSNRFSSI